MCVIKWLDRISNCFYANAVSSLAGFVDVVGLISSVIQCCTDTRSWKDWICQGFCHLLLLTKRKSTEEVQKEQNTLDANSEQWKYRRTTKGKKEEEKGREKKIAVDGCGCDVCMADLFSSDNIITCTFWNTFFVFWFLFLVSGFWKTCYPLYIF